MVIFEDIEMEKKCKKPNRVHFPTKKYRKIIEKI